MNCRALVGFTTPDGAPVLRRPLSPPERKRLSARAADLEAALAPARRALAQISAVLKAPVCGDLAGPQAARAPRMCFPLARLPLWSKARCRDEP